MEKRLISMLNDLGTHKRSREELDIYYVNLRLNTSLYNYFQDLNKDTEYLETRNQEKLLRKLNKQL